MPTFELGASQTDRDNIKIVLDFHYESPVVESASGCWSNRNEYTGDTGFEANLSSICFVIGTTIFHCLFGTLNFGNNGSFSRLRRHI